ncbi:hypothetical protein PGT21_036999 [Puccinia graminis f. sp. tritici]|uniref:Uncharacterized protein n=1 Tax=Puccinia graminis f. sp. tritici TaxID=56615 RepID=A0A5B0QQD0_PUCGR|nr:hypothetical protein PGT21_036999 [Puccinia graminis f. sp. tritici]
MHAKVLLIGLVTTAWCMKLIIKPEVGESDSKAIEDLASSSTQQYQGLTTNVVEERGSKIPKLAHSPDDQGLNSSVELSNSQRQVQIAQYVQSPNFNCACQPRGHCRSVFQRLIQDSHLLKYLHPRKALMLSKCWERNHDQVLSLDKDWEEILGVQLRKKKDASSLQYLPEDIENKTKPTRDLYEKLKEKISALRDVKLMKFGGLYSTKIQKMIIESLDSGSEGTTGSPHRINDFPGHLVEDIMGVTWEKFTGSILEEMKDIMINHKTEMMHLEFYDTSHVPAGKYFLKLVAFFSKEKLIGEKTVLNFIHDKELTKEVFECALDSYRQEGTYTETHIMYMCYKLEYIFNSWYRPITHGFFKGFDTMEKRIVTLHSVVAKMLRFGDISITRSNTPKEWHQKISSVSVKEYGNNLQELLKGSDKTAGFDDTRKPQTDPNYIARNKVVDGVGRLTEILQSLLYPNEFSNNSSFYEGLLSISICQVLTYTEMNCNGIVGEIERNIIPSNRLEEYRLSKKLIMNASKVFASYIMLKSFNTSTIQNTVKNYERDHLVYFFKAMERCQETLIMTIPVLKSTYYKLNAEHNLPTFSLELFLEISALVIQVEQGNLAKEIETSINHLKILKNDTRLVK